MVEFYHAVTDYQAEARMELTTLRSVYMAMLAAILIYGGINDVVLHFLGAGREMSIGLVFMSLAVFALCYPTA